MKFIQKDDKGSIIAASDIQYEGFVASTENYEVGFDGKLYSEAEMQSEEYKQRKAKFDVNSHNNTLSQKYIPPVEKSLISMAKKYLQNNPPKTANDKIELSGLYAEWQPGNYTVGDICNYAGQTWECWTAHHNAIYPDITPDNAQTWANFWRPLHGTSLETARPWVKPQYGTTDMYHAGEYMVYTDDKIYRCLTDTVYSPEEYAQAWETV